jgi:hypothetical protein
MYMVAFLWVLAPQVCLVEETLSTILMEIQILFKQTNFLFPNLYKCCSLYVLMDFYLILLKKVCPRSSHPTDIAWSASKICKLLSLYKFGIKRFAFSRRVWISINTVDKILITGQTLSAKTHRKHCHFSNLEGVVFWWLAFLKAQWRNLLLSTNQIVGSLCPLNQWL